MQIKIVLFIISILIVPPIYADEMYKWVDDEGVLHVTDDPGGIPEKYRDSKLLKREEMTTSPSPRKSESKNIHTNDSYEKESYGEHPLYWWKDAFERLESKIRYIEAEVRRTKNSIAAYDNAAYDKAKPRIKSKEEISNYESLRMEVTMLEKRLREAKEEMAELQRKATYHGVPRNIRE